ncbi:hypothetical protein JNW88_05255 [Micromonospora sp. ATA32]|nr:hypothetical protein [Micromonospora sp. ATA32]
MIDGGHHIDHRANTRGSVNAIDVDLAGIDVDALLAAFTRHPSANQWIYAGRSGRAHDGWTARPYTGTQPGERRLHLGIRATVEAEQDQRPWGLTEDNGMDAKQFLALLKDPTVATQLRALPWQYTGGGIPRGMSTLGVLNEVVLTVRALGEVVARESANPAEVRALLADLPAPPVDVEALADAVAARVLAALPEGAVHLSREGLAATVRTVLAKEQHSLIAAEVGP